MKVKYFCTANDVVIYQKRQPIKWGKPSPVLHLTVGILACNLGRKMFLSFISSRSQSVTKGSKGRNSSQELKQRLWKNAIAQLVSCGLLYVVIKPETCAQQQHCPQWVGPTTSITNRENVPQTGSQPNLINVIPQLSFPLPRCL